MPTPTPTPIKVQILRQINKYNVGMGVWLAGMTMIFFTMLWSIFLWFVFILIRSYVQLIFGLELERSEEEVGRDRYKLVFLTLTFFVVFALLLVVCVFTKDMLPKKKQGDEDQDVEQGFKFELDYDEEKGLILQNPNSNSPNPSCCSLKKRHLTVARIILLGFLSACFIWLCVLVQL